MEHEKTPEELDDLISDIHDLIDEKEELPQTEEMPSDFELPEDLEELIAEPAEEEPAEESPAEEEAPVQEETERAEETTFQQQRWTDRQRVPRHVAKLQQNQEEAYAKWLQEQEEKGDDPIPDLPDDDLESEEAAAELLGKKKKKHGLRWFCIILAALTLIAAVVMIWIVPRQPEAADKRERAKGAISTMLIAGTDDSLGRTDLLMLLSMNSKTNTMAVISLPKTVAVESGGQTMPLGEVYGRNGGGQEGLEALKQAVGGCIGIVPDGCLVLYPDALTEFVEVLGGVDFNVPYEVRTKTVTLNKGVHRLSGSQAYALLRYTDDEVQEQTRMQTQQQFMAALVKKCTGFGAVLKAPALMDQLNANSVNDLTTQNFLWLARTAMGMDHDRTYTETLPGEETELGYVLDSRQVVQTINNFCNPYVRAVTEEDLRILEP